MDLSASWAVERLCVHSKSWRSKSDHHNESANPLLCKLSRIWKSMMDNKQVWRCLGYISPHSPVCWSLWGLWSFSFQKMQMWKYQIQDFNFKFASFLIWTFYFVSLSLERDKTSFWFCWGAQVLDICGGELFRKPLCPEPREFIFFRWLCLSLHCLSWSAGSRGSVEHAYCQFQNISYIYRTHK